MKAQATQAKGPPVSLEPRPRRSWGFVVWWIVLLFLHAANVIYYAGAAWLYRHFAWTYFEHSLETNSIGINVTEHPKISKIHAVIAAIHVLFMLLMVVGSILARRFVFQPELARYTHYMVRRLSGKSKTASSTEGLFFRKLLGTKIVKRLSSTASRSGSFLLARDGLLGVESVYFDHILLIRELVETSLQTYQVFRMSQVLPRLWLIRFYLALLVINCWAVPFLHRYYRNKENLRRLLCLLCDAVLDMLSSIGVSIIIFATYAPQYTDPNLFGFPMASWYDDEWFSNMQQEFQIMLVASWTDMLSRLVFAVGLLQCMEAIKDLLTTWTITASGPTDTVSNKAVIPTGTEIDAKLGPKLDEMAGAMNDNPAESFSDKLAKPSLSRLPLETIQSDNARKKKDWFHRAIHFIVHIGGPGLFVTWGFVLIAVHVTAESNHNKAQCSLNLKPWFSSKPGCSLVELNCRSLRSSGHDEVIGSVWDAFDPDRAAGIVIRHCAELVVPSKIQDYHHITSLKVYNSTVVGWDDDSALTSTKNPNLRTIFLIRTFTTTGQLPRGMLSPDFPSGVRNIYMSVTNFPTLPNDLDTRWPKRLMLSMEFSPVTSIPDVVVRLDPLSVSFAGTAISTVSTEIFELPHVDGILFGLTRVQELPRNVSSINPVIRAILLQYTNVTEFWSWMDHYAYFLQTFPGRAFNAFGTPYCRELLEIANGNRTAFSVSPKPDHSVLMDVSTPAKLAFVMRAIECSTPIPLSSFPLPLEDAKHAWT